MASGGASGVPPTMAQKVPQMSSRRLVLPIKFCGLIFKISGIDEGLQWGPPHDGPKSAPDELQEASFAD